MRERMGGEVHWGGTMVNLDGSILPASRHCDTVSDQNTLFPPPFLHLTSAGGINDNHTLLLNNTHSFSCQFSYKMKSQT